MPLIGLYLAGCALLVVAGSAKSLRPATAAQALAEVVPMPPAAARHAVRLLAGSEAALGVLALVRPGAGAAPVGASYACFAAYVALVRAKGGALATCGCFGTPDTPATALHLVVDAVLAVAGCWVAADHPGGTVVGALRAQPLHGVPLALASALCAWLALHVMTTAGRLVMARRITVGEGARHRWRQR
ncbi:MAG TPA: MauE/DoxX family redox-associated membrane protein [Acidimicrobiales bacterium]|nr:MauE/DoxX family redox-associated membrane protein [Acidimicrobiales bacterium]